MRTTPFILIAFFVSLNVSLYMINESNVLGVESVYEPLEDPTDILGRLATLDGTDLMIGGIPLIASSIIGFITGHLLLGASLGIILFAFNLLIPVVNWILMGFPEFLYQMNAPYWIVIPVQVMMALVWFWFMISFIGQRAMETT